MRSSTYAWGWRSISPSACVLSGLAHVAADDVVVERLAPVPWTDANDPYGSSADKLPAQTARALPIPVKAPDRSRTRASLQHALEMARGPRPRMSVTLDARALDGAITGTQVHIVELILALARTAALRLRLLVRTERIDDETLELLRGLPATEILAAEDLDAGHAEEHRLSPSAADLLARRRRARPGARRAVRAQPTRHDRLSQPRLFQRRPTPGRTTAAPAATVFRPPSEWSCSRITL